MKITLDISPERIADLFTTAIESGDPVTTAARGGWCVSIKLVEGIHALGGSRGARDCWYADPETWAGEFLVEIAELDDERTGHETVHEVRPADVARGLAAMAAKYSHLFEQVTDDNIDAPCADIFLQCVLFGEEKYA